MKINATITADHGTGGPMETAIRLAMAASDADLEKLAALGRCLSAAAKAERSKRQPKEASAPVQKRRALSPRDYKGCQLANN